MIDATISMTELFAQLKIFLPRIFDDTYLTLEHEKFPGCLEMQIVLYRNYNSEHDQILETSTLIPGLIVLEMVMLWKYVPFAAEGFSL